MATFFSDILIDLRKTAGFSTAYRFYHDNGGKPVLTFSYRKYLLFEQGEALPSPEVLRRLSLALKLIPQSPAAGKLAAAWLKTLAGEETYAAVFEPFVLVKASEGMTPLHSAMGKILKRHPVSVAEALVLLSSYDHYRAFLFLENESIPLSPAAFGKILGLKERDAAKILLDFAKAGLVKKNKSGAYVCELSNEVLELPRAEILPPGLNDKMREYQAKMMASGKLAWRRLKTLRADAVELAGFYPLLSLNMSAASAYEIDEKTKNSAVFAIESRVVKLFDF
jgi:hypothetical protein